MLDRRQLLIGAAAIAASTLPLPDPAALAPGVPPLLTSYIDPDVLRIILSPLSGELYNGLGYSEVREAYVPGPYEVST